MKRRAYLILWGLAFCFSLMASSAGCDVIDLPERLQVIGEEAFLGCESINEVFLPDTIQSVSARAFDGLGEAVWIHCPPGQTAIGLLCSGLDVDADTACRAFIVGQSYAGTDMALPGASNVARALYFCLAASEKMQYRITQRINLTASGILEGISNAFFDASEYDISFFFFSGHGETGGALVGSDSLLVSPQQLRDVLDAIPGRKILVVDACFSGGILETDATAATRSKLSGEKTGLSVGSDPESFNAAFLSAFSNGRNCRTPQTGFSQYYVMTSARSDEYCEEGLIHSGTSSRVMGYFTFFLCKGCGWDGVLSAAVGRSADMNRDGLVSFAEAFAYASEEAKAFNAHQNAQSNMGDCGSFSPFR